MSGVLPLQERRRRAARNRKLAGFNLLELMAVVIIIGILAAIAIPTFSKFQRRSRTAEVSEHLNAMFKSAASFYGSERATGAGPFATRQSECIVASDAMSPSTPGKNKQNYFPGDSAQRLGFTISDFVYMGYGISSSVNVMTCGIPGGTAAYTFYARGDLDADSTLSTFELSTATDANGSLYHGRAMYVDNELE